MSFTGTRLLLWAALPAAVVACAPQTLAVPEPPPPARPSEEPLPGHWIGAFTKVESRNAPVTPQFRLELGREAPNHFRATRGCYSQQGWLKRRGEVWIVEQRGGIHVDEHCMATSLHHKGSAEGLFQHRAVTLSPPGPERWIAEGPGRWLYLQNPAEPPRPMPSPRPAPPAPAPLQLGAHQFDAAEALYRHQIGNNASGGQRKVAAHCFALGSPGSRADPPGAILDRFRTHRAPVKGVSGCRWDGVQWLDRETGGPAIVHYIAELSCPSATRCTARGGYLEANMSASGNSYALERKGGRWQVVSDVMNWIS